MVYIFDIDGTLAHIDHRLHFIRKQPPDWKGFFKACPDDEPIHEIIQVARSLHAFGNMIVLVSGRSDEVQAETRAWLKKHDIPFVLIFLRPAGDHREDSIVKSEMLDRLTKHIPQSYIAGVFEDRQQVVDMYRKRGLRVFQVASGDF